MYAIHEISAVSVLILGCLSMSRPENSLLYICSRENDGCVLILVLRFRQTSLFELAFQVELDLCISNTKLARLFIRKCWIERFYMIETVKSNFMWQDGVIVILVIVCWFLFRRHPTPTREMLEPLLQTAAAVGLHLDVSSSKALADSLDHAVVNIVLHFY